MNFFLKVLTLLVRLRWLVPLDKYESSDDKSAGEGFTSITLILYSFTPAENNIEQQPTEPF